MDTTTNRSHPAPRSGNLASAAPGASAAELGRIAADVEAFLELWVGRLEKVLGQIASGSTDEQTQQERLVLQQRMAEFELARRHWNEERRRDVQQIQETTEQLSAAWERLEEEQRRVLQSQTGVAGPGAPGPRPTIDRPLVPANPAPSLHPQTPPQPHPVSPHPASVNVPLHARASEPPAGGELRSNETASAARDRAVRQFQILRRQVGSLPG
ncbi:hypothetical protein [Candidatus Laterigemmans baculatus]|nr:hypothetical protein [Candidatus Laterigemmans baculatus]